MTKEFNPPLTETQAKTIIGMAGFSVGLHRSDNPNAFIFDKTLCAYVTSLYLKGGGDIREKCERTFSVSPSSRDSSAAILKAMKAEQP